MSGPVGCSPDIVLILTALLIGLSRIHLGVHYPTDVIGGYLAGGAWLLLSLVALSKLSPHASAPPADSV